MEALCLLFLVIFMINLFRKSGQGHSFSNVSSCETKPFVRHPAGYPRTLTDCHEIAYSFESEDCIYQFYDTCAKNPKHDGLIPINEVNIESFPPGYQTQSLVDLVKALGAVTVKLTVKALSTHRPKTFADNQTPYPLGDKSGQPAIVVGTGRIRFMNKSPFYDNKPCPCKDCAKSLDPNKEWWMVGIVTAAHVVVDKNEAENTTCQIDYDTEGDRLKKEKILQCYGIAERGVFIEEDRCNMLFCTHDSAMARELSKRVDQYKAQCEKVMEEFKNKEEKDLVIIVSHPHGRAKFASFGRLEGRIEVETMFTKYEYNAPTCPGSSGAPVYVLSRRKLPFCNHPHSAAKENNKTGYSSGGY